MNLIVFQQLVILTVVLADDCNIDCSYLIEPVCGMLMEPGGATTIEHYQNICHLNKMKCRLKGIKILTVLPDGMCGEKPRGSRRVNDFSIVGGHQACNHSCPTYCIDTYDPVCAQIHYLVNGAKKNEMRPMVNHCHVDLFSCSVGVNVTIASMSKCIQAHSLMFMTSMVAMKTFGFIPDRRRRSITYDDIVRTIPNEASDEKKNRDTSHEKHKKKNRKRQSGTNRLGWTIIHL